MGLTFIRLALHAAQPVLVFRCGLRMLETAPVPRDPRFLSLVTKHRLSSSLLLWDARTQIHSSPGNNLVFSGTSDEVTLL